MPSRLVELEIARPGIYGTNTSASGDVMPKEYSVDTKNCVFSDEGYLEARHGTRREHTDTLSSIIGGGATAQTVRTIYHTQDENGNDLVIFSTEDAIFRLNGNTVTDISTGTITAPTAGNWKFQNLNDTIIGQQAGHKMIELTTPSSGTFNDITFTGTEKPVGDGATSSLDILAAAGRLWVLDDDQLRYSDILDHTTFDPSTTSGGAFDLNAVRLTGEHKEVALTEFNGNILVFFDKSIVVYTGIYDPDAIAGASQDMQTTENIKGVGCIARDSIQHTQNDVVFLSEQGVTSLSRVVQEKSMPIRKLSDNMVTEMRKLILDSTMSNMWSAYVEGKGIYLIGSSDHANTYMIDVAMELPDGSRRMSYWTKQFTTMHAIPLTMVSGTDDVWSTLLCSSESDYISVMGDYLDDASLAGTGGDSYDIQWTSAWTPIDDELENHIKIPKDILITVRGSGDQAIGMNLAYDYGEFDTATEETYTIPLGSVSLYGTATYGGAGSTVTTTGYYGASGGINQGKGEGFGDGRILKVRLQATVDQYALALQRVSIKAKIGRQE